MAEVPELNSLSTPETVPPPPLPQPPHTVEEADEEGGGEVGKGKVEVSLRDTARLLILPPAVALFHPSSPSYSPILKKCAGRRKKNFLNAKQRVVAEQRLELLNENFRPISFSPGKALDFSAHEQLFQALGLLDFAHLELDVEVRPDLLAHLIAYYDPLYRRSYVNGTRISVSRVDLARAIGLPSKKDKANVLQSKDSIQDLIFADGAIPILLDFMSNYMLFEDDMCIVPTEIIQAIQFVKEGVPYKVDWASVMWVFVEKELLEAPKTGRCCYASHLQRLIKSQHPLLFSKKLALPSEHENEGDEVPIADEAVNAVEAEINAAEEAPLEEEEEEGADHDIIKMRSLEDLVNVASDRHNSEFGLTLGESTMNGFDDCRVNEECQLFEGKNVGLEQCLLQRCNSKAFGIMDFDILTKVDEEEKERFMDDCSVKLSNLEKLISPDHFDEMENVNTLYAQQVNSNPSSDMMLTSCSNSHKNIILDHGLSGSINFGNHGKRKVDGIVDDEEEDQFDHNNKQKRMRGCQPWINLPPSSSFDECLDLIHRGIKGVSIHIAEKDQERVNMEMQMRYLNHLLEEKEQAIQSLKMAMEGQPNWQMSVRQYEDELCLVTQMMLGYKRALKETRSRFSDYRKMHPHDEESLYKDVPGEGGLVLSAREFEKYRLALEEDKRQKLLGTFCSLDKILNKFEECEEGIMVHDSKLEKLVGEMEQLKEGFVRSNCSDT
ncbi:hypothetical protein KSP39_PZI023483 [Platanthera zijinensis]|uniref:Uncharacterized protein n=1 Tax=Platanthera zijinensis TaxID=2320716 RepID=A0AAP0ASZ7_9ASPA